MPRLRPGHVVALAFATVALAAAAVLAFRSEPAEPTSAGLPLAAAQTVDGGAASTATTAPPPPTTTAVPVVPMAVAAGPSAPVVSRIDTTDRVVFLTIDDGVVRDAAALELLRKRQVPFTMFLNPPFVDQDPAYFSALRDLGASVQNHTVNHKMLPSISAAEQQREICNAQAAFEARFGERPWLLRPPGGATNSSVQYVARTGCGIRAVVLWRATMNDGRLDVQGGGTLQPGDIVLLHFRHDLAHNLDVVLEAAKRASLTPARLEDYLPPA